jgi:hypothetical protein
MSDNKSLELLFKKLNENKFQNTIEIINSEFPGWILNWVDHYSNDYSYMENNWKKICEIAEVKTKEILFVDDIDFKGENEKQKAFLLLSELLTRNGYCVRRLEEFTLCKKCAGAIPCKEIWKKLKECNMPVPKIWKENCTNC